MANPSVTSEPKKTINSFESRWNASSLPIVFTINNDKYPTGETVTNYRTEIDIYVDGALIGQIEQIPDSNNNTVVDVRKYVQTGLTLKPIGTVNDTNAWCEFYIIAREKYTDIYGNDKEHGADGDSEIFYATLSALQFGNSRGGNMYDYVVDQDKTDTASFMTFFERGQLLDTTTYYLNIILNESPVDLDVNQYDINGNLLQNDLLDIDDEGIGLYRITLDSIDFNDDTTYITAQVFSNLYGEALSELFTIDVDLDCAVTVSTPTGLAATATSTSEIDVSWDAVAGDDITYILKRGTTEGGSKTEIATGLTSTSYEDSGLSEATEYFYTITAKSGGISSSPSSEASAITFYNFGNMGAFDGVNDASGLVGFTAVSVPNEWTINIWYRETDTVASATATKQRFVSWGQDGTHIMSVQRERGSIPNNDKYAIRLVLDGNLWNPSTPTISKTDATIPIDYNKHQIAIVVNQTNKTIRMYADGVFLQEDTYTNAGLSTFGLTVISFTEIMLGGIAEIRIIGGGLTDAEVTEEYNDGDGGGFIARNYTDANHLALWRFNETSGTTVSDDGPDSIDVTINNIADSGYGTQLTTSSESGSPTVGDLVTGGTSGATGLVVSHVATDLEIEQVKGVFQAAETVTSTGYSATVDSVLTRFWDKT